MTLARSGILLGLSAVVVALAAAGCSVDDDEARREAVTIDSAQRDPELQRQLQILQEDGWTADWSRASTERLDLPSELVLESGEHLIDRVSVPLSRPDASGEVVGRAHLLYVQLATGPQVAVTPDDERSATFLGGGERVPGAVPNSARHIEQCYDNGVVGNRFKICLHYDPGVTRGAWADGYADGQYSNLGIDIDLQIGHGDDLSGGDWISALGGSRRTSGVSPGKISVDWNRHNDHRAAWVKRLGACLYANENGAFVKRCAPSIAVGQWGCQRVSSRGVTGPQAIACYRIPSENHAGAWFYVTTRSGPENGLLSWVADASGNAVVCPTPHRGDRSVLACGYPGN